MITISLRQLSSSLEEGKGTIPLLGNTILCFWGGGYPLQDPSSPGPPPQCRTHCLPAPSECPCAACAESGVSATYRGGQAARAAPCAMPTARHELPAVACRGTAAHCGAGAAGGDPPEEGKSLEIRCEGTESEDSEHDAAAPAGLPRRCCASPVSVCARPMRAHAQCKFLCSSAGPVLWCTGPKRVQLLPVSGHCLVANQEGRAVRGGGDPGKIFFRP